MTPRFEHADFATHLNSKFRIRIDDAQTVESELTELSELMLSPGQEQFSLVFRTSNEFFLGQGLRSFEHEVMGQFELFLVPIGRDAAGTSYEAVFNRLVKEN